MLILCLHITDFGGVIKVLMPFIVFFFFLIMEISVKISIQADNFSLTITTIIFKYVSIRTPQTHFQPVSAPLQLALPVIQR